MTTNLSSEIVKYLIALKSDDVSPTNVPHRQYRQQLLDEATKIFLANYSSVNLVNELNIVPALVVNSEQDDFEDIWKVKLVKHNSRWNMQGTPTIPKDLEKIVDFIELDNDVQVI